MNSIFWSIQKRVEAAYPALILISVTGYIGLQAVSLTVAQVPPKPSGKAGPRITYLTTNQTLTQPNERRLRVRALQRPGERFQTQRPILM